MVDELRETLNTNVENLTLAQAYFNWSGDEPHYIPFLVWLLENPESPVALPGKISLKNHDYIHILLGRTKSTLDEAFVVGFTMGNDMKTKWFHLLVFKFFASWLYPYPYRFSAEDLKVFDSGVTYGRSVSVKQLNDFDFKRVQDQTVTQLRKLLLINSI